MSKRGSPAENPLQFSFKDWKAIMSRLVDAFSTGHISLISAGVTFYYALSIFPLLLVFVSLYGLFTQPTDIFEHLQIMKEVVPTDIANLLNTYYDEVIPQEKSTLSIGFGISVATALWSSSKGMRAFMEGLNIVYGETKTRSLLKEYTLSLGLTFVILIFGIIAISAIVCIPIITEFIGPDSVVSQALNYSRWPILAVLFGGFIAFLTRYATVRNEPKWSWVSLGSILSVVCWILISSAFSYYVSQFGGYNKTYGSVAGFVILLMWLYLSNVIVLAGAALNAEIEHHTSKDSTVGRPRPMGKRGAFVADTRPEDEG